MHNLVDASDIFFLLGQGEGESEAPGGGRGDRFLIENPRRGGLQRRRGRGAGRVSAANWGIFGGGQIFFFGAEMSTKIKYILENISLENAVKKTELRGAANPVELLLHASSF